MAAAIGIVWRELHRADGKRLVPAQGGDPDLLAATIGNLVRLYGPGAFCGEAPAPRVDDDKEAPLYQRYAMLLDQSDVQQGRLGDTPLPLRAVLWEVEDGAPAGPSSFPRSANWVLGTATIVGDYKVAGDEKGPRYRLWISQDAPLDAPYISSLTGTGVPTAIAPRPRLAWALSLLGALLFVWGLLSLSYAGSVISDVYFLLQQKRPVRMEHFFQLNKEGVCRIFKTTGDTCDNLDVRTYFSVCLKQIAPSVLQESPPPVVPATTVTQCSALIGLMATYSSRTLVGEAPPLLGEVSSILLGWWVPSVEPRSVSIDRPLILMMAAVVLLLMGLSYSVVGRGLGWIISPQNRFSLALAQSSCWTILLLSSAMGMAAFNAGLGATAAALAAQSVTSGFFPSLQPVFWSMLGITVSSPALSMIIKTLRGSVPADNSISVDQDATRTRNGIGVLNSAMPVVARPSPADAHVTDLFVGEEASTENKIDISRLQMMMITAGLLVTYGQSIMAMVRERSAESVFLAAGSGQAFFSRLPDVGSGMLVMLIVSHGTYLVSKAVTPAPAGSVKQFSKPMSQL